MKKLLFMSAVVAFSTAHAQSAGLEGTTYITGQAMVSTSKDNNTGTTATEFSVVPMMGHFITPTVVIGAGLGYQGSTMSIDTDMLGFPASAKLTSSAFVVMPFVRKYWDLGTKLYIFGQLDVPLEFGTVKTEANAAPLGSFSSEDNYTAYGINIRPGLDYMINNNWTVEATIGAIGYNSVNPKDGESMDNFTFGVNLNQVTFGVKYLFK